VSEYINKSKIVVKKVKFVQMKNLSNEVTL